VRLLDSLQSLLAGLIALARKRLELAGAEVEERIARVLVAGLCVLAVAGLALLGLGFAAAGIVLAAAPENRLAVVAGLAVVFIALAALGAWSLRSSARRQPPLFDASVRQLERDCEALRACVAAEARPVGAGLATLQRVVGWAAPVLAVASLFRRR
jgi:uncharacterized membrane protein YqjE